MAEPAWHTKNQRKRLWLKILFTKEAWTSISDALSSINGFNKKFFTQAGTNRGVVYLPVTAAIPALTYKNEYTQLLGDIDMTTRALFQFGGGMASTAGSEIKEHFGNLALTGGIAKGLGAILGAVGSFATTMGGNVDSTKLWNKATVEDIAVGGTIGIASFEEYSYYKMAKLVLQQATIPIGMNTVLSDGVQKAKDAVVSALNMQGTIIDEWTPYVMQKPANECEMEILVGQEKAWRSIGDRDLSERITSPTRLHRPKLFALGYSKLTMVDFNEGTDSGRGIADDGSSRIMDYSLTFSPDSLSSVQAGIYKVRNSIDFEKQKDNATVDGRSSNAKAIDTTNDILFYALNAGLVASSPGYYAARVQNATLGVAMLLINKGVEAANVGLGYARAVKQATSGGR